MEIMDHDALLHLVPGPNTRDILSSLLRLVDSIVVTCNAEEDAAASASASTPWSLALHNPNMTKTSILVRPDWTGVACMLDWSGTIVVPLGYGMARVKALLDELPHTEELQRHALLEFQAAATTTLVSSSTMTSTAAAAPTADVLLQAQAVGHYLTYADIAIDNNADKQDHVRRCFETMQLRVLDCHMWLWEIQHFGLGFAAAPNRKAEPETSPVLNPGHKRTRSGTYIDAEPWGAKSAQNRLDQDQVDGTVPDHATGHHCLLSE